MVSKQPPLDSDSTPTDDLAVTPPSGITANGKTKISFLNYLAQKRNEIILSAIGFILAGIIVATGLVIGQEYLKNLLFDKTTTARIEKTNSSLAVFPSDKSYEVVELLEYEISLSDYAQEVTVIATFKQNTEIVRSNVLYSIDIEGFSEKAQQSPQLTPTVSPSPLKIGSPLPKQTVPPTNNAQSVKRNHIELSLHHPLNLSTKAKVYFLVRKIVSSKEDIKLEDPNIHVEGKDKNGNKIYH